MFFIKLLIISLAYSIIGDIIDYYNIIDNNTWWAFYGFVWGVFVTLWIYHDTNKEKYT